MKELIVPARVDQLDAVLDFISGELAAAGCPTRARTQLAVAAEEIFVNIANYAYQPGEGPAAVRVEILDQPPRATLQFRDSGAPYDPLAKADPDITLSAEQRDIGGLGIYMVKKSMDEVAYAHQDGQNILTIVKNI